MSEATVTGVGVRVERLAVESFEAPRNLTYVDVHGLHGLFDALFPTMANVALVGPKGEGKTLAVQAWAAKNGYPLVTVDCSEDIRRGNMVGMYTMRGDQTPFVLGPLATAISVANEVGKCVLVMEEMNSLTPQMQKVLNPLLDFRRKVEIPEAGLTFKLKPNAQLAIAATMNSSVYGGVFAMNEDLKSRFRIIQVSYPPPAKEKELIRTVLMAEGIRVEEKILDAALTLAQETRQKALDFSLSTRDLVQLLTDVQSLGLPRALWLVAGKFEDNDRATVKARIQSTFAVDIDSDKAR